MKNILLVLTGGTIGSFQQNGIINTKKGKCRVLELFKEKYPDSDCQFEIKEPLNILSENLTYKDWERLINFILSLDLSAFDGIIITHGSDTLSYSSAMLSMCLHGIGLPVVITASNYVPDHPKSNALVNFKAAVELIHQIHDGVYTVYTNPPDLPSQLTHVFLPTRMKEADRFMDCFYEIDSIPLAIIDKTGDIREHGNPLSVCDLEQHQRFFSRIDFHFEKGVQLIHPYPSINYDDITLGQNIGAVLHITYHSGTVSEKALTLLAKCKERNIPLFLCSLKSSAKAIYETSNSLLQNGAVPLYDISTESAYAKLLLAVNLYNDNIKSFMNKNIYFERLEESE